MAAAGEATGRVPWGNCLCRAEALALLPGTTPRLVGTGRFAFETPMADAGRAICERAETGLGFVDALEAGAGRGADDGFLEAGVFLAAAARR